MHENTINRELVELACEAAEIDFEHIVDDYEGRGFGVEIDPRGSSLATAVQFAGTLAAQLSAAADVEDLAWVDNVAALMDSVRSDHRNYSSAVVYFRGWGIA